MEDPLPVLHVEGPDDISIISGLLRCHNVVTFEDRVVKRLKMVSHDGVDPLLAKMPTAIRTSNHKTVGFVIDIDTTANNKWNSIRAKLGEAGISAESDCPPNGFIGKVPDFQSNCGVWMMPDCKSDCGTMEDLIESLLPVDDPLWPYAKKCTQGVAEIISAANQSISDPAKQ